MANGDGSKLNETEIKVRDGLKTALGTRATITKIQQDNDKVQVQITSPNDFTRTADILQQVAPEIAKQVKGGLSINLTTWWPSST